MADLPDRISASEVELPKKIPASEVASSGAHEAALVSSADAPGMADFIPAAHVASSEAMSVGEAAPVKLPEDTRSVFNPIRGLDELKSKLGEIASAAPEVVPKLAGAAVEYGKNVGANAVDLVKRNPEAAWGAPTLGLARRAFGKTTGQTAFGENSYLVPPKDVATLRAYMNNLSYGTLAARVEGEGEGQVPKGTYKAAEESQPAASALGGLTSYVPFGKAKGISGALKRSTGIAALQTGGHGLAGEEVSPANAFGAAGINLALEGVTHGTLHFGGKAVQAIHSLDPNATAVLRESIFKAVQESEAARVSQGGLAEGAAVTYKGPPNAQPPLAVALSTTPQGELKLREGWLVHKGNGELKHEFRDTVNPTPEQVQKARAAVGGEVQTSIEALDHPVAQNAIIPYANRTAPRGDAAGAPVGQVLEDLETIKNRGKRTGPNTLVPYAAPAGVSDTALAEMPSPASNPRPLPSDASMMVARDEILARGREQVIEPPLEAEQQLAHWERRSGDTTGEQPAADRARMARVNNAERRGLPPEAAAEEAHFWMPAAAHGRDPDFQDVVPPEPSFEEAPTLIRNRQNLVALDNDGHVRLLPLEAEVDPRPPDTRAIQVGDVVKLKHAGGEIPGVRVVGLGARENVSRKLGPGTELRSAREEMNPNLARVLLPGASKPTVWPLDALHLDTPQEAAHFESFSAEPGQLEDTSLGAVRDEIRKMGYVSPGRLASRYGFSPEDSAMALETLRASGDLAATERSGVYAPTSPIEPKPGASPGFAVAYGREGSVGRFDGADPNKPGNYRIETEPGKYVSLPPSEFNTLRPITLANKDRAKVPAELGITVPMQPGMVAPSLQTASEINAAVKLAKQFRLSEAGTKSKLQDVVTYMVRNELHRSPPLPWTGPKSQGDFEAPPLWEAKAKLGASAKYYDPVVQTTIKALDKIGLGKPSDYDFAAILPVQKGSASDAALLAWAQKYPARAKSVYETGQSMLKERDALEEKVAALDPTGTIASKQNLRSMNGAGEYVRGIFNAHQGSPLAWSNYVEKQQPKVWQAAVELIDSELAKAGFQGSRGPAVEGIMQDLLNYGNEGLAGKMRARGTPAKVAKTFESRVTLAPQVKALLGANQSGIIQMAHTLATLRVQASQLEAWKLVAESPYWSRPVAGRDGELPPRYDLTVKVPPGPQFGQAAGGWIHPRLAYLLDMPKSSETGFGFANALGRAWKKNVTVFGGPSVWLNNAMRNVPDSIAAGGFDPARPDEFLADMREAARVMHEYRKDPTHIGKGGLTAEAMDFNALSPGLMAAEGTRQREFLQRKILESLRGSKATTVPDLLADGLEKMKEGVDSVKDAYDFIDQWFKMANYIALKRQAMAGGKSLNDAAAFASYKVNQNFPNFSQPSQFASAVAGKYGWAAPFATSGLESMRIKGTYIARLAKGDTQLMASMAKGAVMMGAVVGSLNALRRANGISDDDVKHAKTQLPISTRGYDPVLMPMPTLDKQGRVLFVNLSRYNDLSMVAAGSTFDPLWQRLTLGLLNDTVSGGAFMPPVNTAAAAGGLAPETARQNLDQMGRGLPLRGDEGLKTLMSTAMVGAMLPQFPVRVAKALQEGQPQDGQDPRLTQNEVIAKLMGLSLATTGPQAERTRALQAKKMIKDLRGDMVKGALQNKSDPETQKKLLDTQRTMLQEHIKTIFGGEQ